MSNRNRSNPWTAAILAGALALAAFVPAGALAQPKPALTRDVASPAYEPHVWSDQITTGASICQPGSGPPWTSCRFELPAVPAGKRFIVTYVSVQFFASAGANGAEALLGVPGPTFIMLPVPPPQTPGAADVYLAASPVTFVIEPGVVATLTLRAFDLLDGRITNLSVAGYYAPAP